jgi:hypothetical protein
VSEDRSSTDVDERFRFHSLYVDFLYSTGTASDLGSLISSIASAVDRNSCSFRCEIAIGGVCERAGITSVISCVAKSVRGSSRDKSSLVIAPFESRNS